MDGKDYERFSGIYVAVEEMLTGARRGIHEARLAGASKLADAKNKDLPLIFEKLQKSLETARQAVPELGTRPLVDFASAEDRSTKFQIPEKYWFSRLLPLELKRLMVGMETLEASELEKAELFIRRLKKGLPAEIYAGGGYVEAERLPVGFLSVAERCLARCSHCGLDALPSDPLMSWSLFRAIIESPQMLFRTEMQSPFDEDVNPDDMILGDGEVLIYRDVSAGTDLTHVLDALIFERPQNTISFTTAGLISPNRKLGLRVFDYLDSLGPYAKDLIIEITFSLFSAAAKADPDLYLEHMQETIDRVNRLRCTRGVLVTYDDANRDQTWKLESRLRRGMSAEFRGAWPVGRGALNVKGDGSVEPDRTGSPLSPRVDIRADGSVARGCAGFGIRTASFGNVTINDARQIRELKERHDAALKEYMLRNPGEHRCSWHRKWDAPRLVAPPSANPVVRLPQKRIRLPTI